MGDLNQHVFICGLEICTFQNHCTSVRTAIDSAPFRVLHEACTHFLLGHPPKLFLSVGSTLNSTTALNQSSLTSSCSNSHIHIPVYFSPFCENCHLSVYVPAAHQNPPFFFFVFIMSECSSHVFLVFLNFPSFISNLLTCFTCLLACLLTHCMQ